MELLLNDLSLHKQFDDLHTFREAIQRVMLLRHLANGLGCQIYSHRGILNRFVTPSTSLYHVLQELQIEQRRSILQWLTKHGPFWDEIDQHSPDLLMCIDDEFVTETAVGEAAYCKLVGIERPLVSFSPSTWENCPLTVKVDPDSESETDVTVNNYWQPPELEAALIEAEPPVTSWAKLEAKSRTVFQRLDFSADCYNSLKGYPFAPGVADRMLVLLGVLDQLMGAVDSLGRRNTEGHRLYQDHFTGDKAWFSDSSDSEKRRFRKELTFPNPRGTGEQLFCTWHGKVRNHPPYRIHFAWPEGPGSLLSVVYIGVKLTLL